MIFSISVSLLSLTIYPALSSTLVTSNLSADSLFLRIFILQFSSIIFLSSIYFTLSYIFSYFTAYWFIHLSSLSSVLVIGVWLKDASLFNRRLEYKLHFSFFRDFVWQCFFTGIFAACVNKSCIWFRKVVLVQSFVYFWLEQFLVLGDFYFVIVLGLVTLSLSVFKFNLILDLTLYSYILLSDIMYMYSQLDSVLTHLEC